MLSPRERLQTLLRVHCECRWREVRATWPWSRQLREWIGDVCRPMRPLRVAVRLYDRWLEGVR